MKSKFITAVSAQTGPVSVVAETTGGHYHLSPVRCGSPGGRRQASARRSWRPKFPTKSPSIYALTIAEPEAAADGGMYESYSLIRADLIKGATPG
jgi:hypothetical protein